MTGRSWVRLDNASNIFLAARSDSDPKVFRMSAELDHDVDHQLLQQALDKIWDRYPLYHAVLRTGVFWYYLQHSTLRPVVGHDEEHTCAAIYQYGRRNLLFRVVHHRRRISLEIFHALSDGTGALWFLTDLLKAYAKLRAAPPQEAAGADVEPSEPEPQTVHGLTVDSFAHHFRRRGRNSVPEPATTFSRDAAPPSALTGSSAISAAEPHPHREAAPRTRRRIHHPTGTRTPDNRTRAVELTMPASDVLELARAEDTTLTMYLTALFFESIHRASGGLGRDNTLTASVPVNLRQFFGSESARNFFATIRIHHTFGEGDDGLGAICRNLDSQFRPKATREALEKKLRRLVQFERNPLLRILPRQLKDVILGVVNRFNNRGLSVAVSNLGRVSLPQPAEDAVGRMFFHVSAARPQFCAISHAGLLTVSFTSPFVETDHVREFARLLTGQGIDVRVAAARVTEDELEEVGP